jgi:hypothetical protein
MVYGERMLFLKFSGVIGILMFLKIMICMGTCKGGGSQTSAVRLNFEKKIFQIIIRNYFSHEVNRWFFAATDQVRFQVR